VTRISPSKVSGTLANPASAGRSRPIVASSAASYAFLICQ
jgi:hypothetical protein